MPVGVPQGILKTLNSTVTLNQCGIHDDVYESVASSDGSDYVLYRHTVRRGYYTHGTDVRRDRLFCLHVKKAFRSEQFKSL